jgi:chitinase
MGSALPAAWAVLLAFSQVATAAIQRRDNLEDHVQLHNVQLQYCPQACDFAGLDPTTWTTYYSVDELSLCQETVLFTVNVQGESLNPRIKACRTSAKGPRMQAGAFYGLRQNNQTDTLAPEMVAKLVKSSEPVATLNNGTCGASLAMSTIDTDTRWTGHGSSTSGDLSTTLLELENYFRNTAECGSALMFARSSNHAVIGAFAGRDLTKSAVATLMRDTVKQHLETNSPGQYVMQTCAVMQSEGNNTQSGFDTRLGIFADLTGDVSSVQGFLAGYIRGVGKCVDVEHMDGAEGAVQRSMTVLVSSMSANATSLNTTAIPSNATTLTRPIRPRAFCRDIQVVSGDSCAALAQRCGISGAGFTKYNSKTSNLCSTLKVKQYVCCSAGDLQDHTPQPSSDGTCYTYNVKADDGCWSIADSYGIDQQRIEDSNKKTWVFSECSGLQVGQIICLSKGNPPMPAVDPTALCGPQVAGTKRPSNWDDIAKQNPCPLNACCDVWGQCGTTADFCTDTTVDGHPGTAKPGTNGCIFNCGTKIVNNASPPSQFSRIGYFEAFNKERDCLHMDVTQMDLNTYTHIHFAFATISKDYKVAMSDGVKDQFEKMVQMDSKGVKKILSFGGWSFSTDHDTSPIFAQGVTEASRELFATNVVQFLKDNNLDGLDFDWEYPGATDIKSSVPASPNDGPNYLKFLQSVKKKLPSGKTVSIAIPARYLRGFPVSDMAKIVDYFIYMTYDLHGQWDFGSKWASPGCATGNCLRSHINKTETTLSLSMITKTGVSANKIMVGVSSYRRNFKMADSSCTDVNCKFTGSDVKSHAEPGECTGTSGYIADTELQSLIEGDDLDGGGTVKTWFDEASASNIMTWNDNWVAYMDSDTKASRVSWIKGLNFGGTTDWAVNLQSFEDPLEGDTSDGELIKAKEYSCDGEYGTLDDLVSKKDNISPRCASQYMLVAIGTLLDDTLTSYDSVKNDYDGKFGYYSQYINDLINPQLENWMDNFDKNEDTKQGLGNQYFNCKYKRRGEDADDSHTYDGPCPVPFDVMSDRPQYDPDVSFEIEYTLEDKDGFEKALTQDLGISLDWIKWEDWDGYDRCEAGTGGGTSGPDARMTTVNGSVLEERAGPCVKVVHMHKGYPRKADSITITDPKTVMEKAMPTIDGLKNQLMEGMVAISLGVYNSSHDVDDAAVALSTPVQMLAQAVQHMADVKDIGADIQAEKKKETILLIVSLVLMIVPFVAEVGLDVAGLTALARFAVVAGEVGNAATAIAEVIDNSESAPFAVMSILAAGAAGKGGKTEATFANAAKARKLLPDVGAMGKTFKEIDDKVQSVMPKCSF